MINQIKIMLFFFSLKRSLAALTDSRRMTQRRVCVCLPARDPKLFKNHWCTGPLCTRFRACVPTAEGFHQTWTQRLQVENNWVHWALSETKRHERVALLLFNARHVWKTLVLSSSSSRHALRSSHYAPRVLQLLHNHHQSFITAQRAGKWVT